MKKTFTLLAGIVCLSLLHFGVKAQIQEPGWPSPTAASLGKYGDIPVSHHTGVPNISIPIHTVQEGDLSLPISLNYHSSGVKVDEVSSWIGLGWSLNAGGMINRSVVGGPDEGQTNIRGNARSNRAGWGWYKDGGFPPEMFNCGSDNPGCLAPPHCNCLNYYQDAGNGYLDTEPDVFTFNVMGHSGKFFFDKNQNPRFFPEGDYLVKPVDNNFSAWTLTAPDGTVFHFGGTGATENTYSGSSSSSLQKVSTAWYLTKIESPNKKHNITFTYAPENYSYGTRSGQSATVTRRNIVGGNTTGITPIINSIHGIRLTKISTGSNHTEITFNPSSGYRTDLTKINNVLEANNEARYLQSIEVKIGTVCKIYDLDVSYFQSPASSSYPEYSHTFDTRRLKLNSIQEKSCDGSLVLPPHSFKYIEGQWNTMARRYSLAKDHWGYYNGQETNKGLIPTVVVNHMGNMITYNGNSIRHSDEGRMKSWVLEQITFPTGGSTIFDYEAHRYIIGSNNYTIGGLRIKTITNNFANGSSITKSFTYDGGILYAGMPKYDINPMDNNYYASSYYTGNDFGIVINSSPNPPLLSTLGYHIGYTNVTENLSDGSKTNYIYNNGHPANFYMKFPPTPPTQNFGSGDLKNTNYLDNSGKSLYFSENNKLVRDVFNSAYALRVGLLPCYNWDNQNQSTAGDCAELLPFFTAYYLTTGYYLLENSIEIKDGVTKKTEYSYRPDHKHIYPISVTTTNSDGKVTKQELTYPLDEGSGAPAIMWDKNHANYQHMISPVVKERTLVNSAVINRKNFNYQLISGKVLLASVDEFPTGTAEMVKSLYSYDAAGNVREIKKDNDIPTSFIWGYKNMYPIAKVVGAARNEVFYTSFEDEVTGVSTTDAKTGGKSKTGGYSLNLTGLTANKLYILSYWQKQTSGWAYVSEEVNLTGTSFSRTLSGQLDDVKFYPKGALISSYTVFPGIGITSQSNPSDVNIRYDYDKFGRLELIKDHKNNILNKYEYHYLGQDY